MPASLAGWVTGYSMSVFQLYFSVIQICASAKWQIITGPESLGHGENSHWVSRIYVRILNRFGFCFQKAYAAPEIVCYVLYIHGYTFFFFLMSVCSIYECYQVCNLRKVKDQYICNFFRGLLHWVNICRLISLIYRIQLWRNKDTCVLISFILVLQFRNLWPFHNTMVFLLYVN